VGKVAFLNDTSAWYHWGCTGTSEAIKETLRKRGLEVASVPIQALHTAKSLPGSSADFDNAGFFNRFFKENLTITAPILQSDHVVINGEGSLHDMSKLPLTILYLAYAAKKFCKKNVQIINHSCYPDGDKVIPGSQNARLYGGVYRLLDFVAIREHRSLEAMRAIGIEPTLSFDCLPLYVKHHPLPAVERKKTIVIAGSVAWKAEGLAALTSYMRAREAEGFVLIVLTGAKANPASDDEKFVSALCQALPEGWTHMVATSMEQWLSVIASASLMLSGRFHYTIAACILDTPPVVLGSNTPKNLALTEAAGLPPPLDYTASDLETALTVRTKEALGSVPLTPEKKQEWVARAEKNFEKLT
jgi:polysaccharide pyruvyl transferase WcaK-like protein